MSPIWHNLRRNLATGTRPGCFELDLAMEQASEGYLQANRNPAAASPDIELVQAGRAAPMRWYPDNVVAADQPPRPEKQAAFASTYIDPLIAQDAGRAPPRDANTSCKRYICRGCQLDSAVDSNATLTRRSRWRANHLIHRRVQVMWSQGSCAISHQQTFTGARRQPQPVQTRRHRVHPPSQPA